MQTFLSQVLCKNSREKSTLQDCLLFVQFRLNGFLKIKKMSKKLIDNLL